MKKIFVATIIAISSCLLMFYLFYNLSPWDDEKINNYIETFGITDGTDFDSFVDDSIRAGIILDYLDFRNIVILHLIFLVAATSILSILHMTVDKLFFKKFYEEPNHISAIRRTVGIPLVLIGVNFTRLVGGFNILNSSIFLLLIFFGILVEYNLIITRREKKMEEVDKQDDQESINIDNIDLNKSDV